jgi:hypothetical protein
MNDTGKNQNFSNDKKQSPQYIVWKEDLLKRLETSSYFQLNDDSSLAIRRLSDSPILRVDRGYRV